uniref:Uncharacterized protein n=1 Tax=Vespula pensylvanica TaxID=30213 RepID=A0A834KME7_VESPE|nr:hypothetical protein H0235_014225 [Vespula pensylvanica]
MNDVLSMYAWIQFVLFGTTKKNLRDNDPAVVFAAGSERSSVAPAQPERPPPPLPPPRFPNSGNQLYEIITESSKACAVFLRNSLRRATNATNSGWSYVENLERARTYEES